MSALRDRIVDVRKVCAAELAANPRNFRTHSKAQSAALKGILEEVGKAAVLVAYTNSAGELTLIDGHLRKDVDPDETWQVAILDVDEAEANKLLLTMDPIAAMAGAAAGRLQALMDEVRTDSEGLRAMLDGLAGGVGREFVPEDLLDSFSSGLRAELGGEQAQRNDGLRGGARRGARA